MMLAELESNFEKAKEANASIGAALNKLKKISSISLHPNFLNVAGYQCKNTYIIKRSDAILAGRAPKDPLLPRGERYFFETLCITPSDEAQSTD